MPWLRQVLCLLPLSFGFFAGRVHQAGWPFAWQCLLVGLAEPNPWQQLVISGVRPQPRWISPDGAGLVADVWRNVRLVPAHPCL